MRMPRSLCAALLAAALMLPGCGSGDDSEDRSAPAQPPVAGEDLGAENITKDAGGRGVMTRISPIAGHGVVLVPEPAVRKRILTWLRARL